MTTTNNNELKACPFCGHNARIESTGEIERSDENYFIMWIQCEGCCVQTEAHHVGVGGAPQFLIELWNTRV